MAPSAVRGPRHDTGGGRLAAAFAGPGGNALGLIQDRQGGE